MLGWWRRRARLKAESQRLLERMTGEPGGRGGAHGRREIGDHSETGGHGKAGGHGDAHGQSGPGRTGDLGDSPLAGLLRAAAGPARPGELAGEQAAVDAFRREFAAGGAGAPVASRRARPPRRRVAVLAAALTAGVLAGVGVAAGAGRLPAPLQSAAHDWIDQVPDHDPAPAPAAPTRTVRTVSPTTPAAQQSSEPAVTPSPAAPTATAGKDMRKLCSEWQKVRDDPHRKPMDPEDLNVLTAAAGGADRIEAFCGLSPAPTGTKSKNSRSSKNA
ncbi:hypothetical protein [Dactylosporangium sp. NPDC006015]|uniref:hypothetical protein n=1 Tax=Dactylosporangium sp. NPDC006015 TaxID=3154576 RepID=UPI0033BCF732